MLLGKRNGTTMKLIGTLGSRKVFLLVDSGSTHNFLSDSLVNDLKVQIGNGDVIRSSCLCQNIQVQLPGLTIIEDYYPFAIGGADLVLGIKWLASLNTVQANWNKMFIIFYLNGRHYKLQGVPKAEQTEATFQCLSNQDEPSGISNNTPLAIQLLLRDFEFVFSEPSSLPPFRNHTHAISLLPNYKPPNIRPYRYPHYQKTEIEKQVADLLQ